MIIVTGCLIVRNNKIYPVEIFDNTEFDKM